MGCGVEAIGPSRTRVLLIRHAETSAPDRFHGAESDVGLGDRGRRQAVHLAGYLSDLGPSAVICSAMRRARDTARPIAEACGVPIRVVEALHERRMPSLSDKAKDAAWGDYLQAMDRWMAGDLDAAPEGDESYAEMRARVVPAYREAVGAFAGRTVVVIAHGLIIRVLLTALLEDHGPAEFARLGIDNCAINDLIWDAGRWQAIALNARPPDLP